MTKTSGAITLELTVDEVNCILEGLGQLPFVRVFALIHKIQEQARLQLKADAVEPEAPHVAPVGQIIAG